MAQKTIVQLIDDLDGTTSDDIQTVTFALDGVTYEIDLTEANATKLRDSIAEFVASGRRIGGRVKRGAAVAPGAKSSAGTHSKEQTKAIREWAKANGHEINERGRIPANIVEAFEAAHN
jgi:hypothetical protein